MYDIKLSAGICISQTDHYNRRNGAGECRTMFTDDRMDYLDKATILDLIFCPREWIAGSRRCEVHYVGIYHIYVGYQSKLVHLFGKSIPFWSHGSVDRDVC